jgi:hypothetical protein
MWNLRASSFLISRQLDGFGLALANFSARQVTSLPDYPGLVPPVLITFLWVIIQPPNKQTGQRRETIVWRITRMGSASMNRRQSGSICEWSVLTVEGFVGRIQVSDPRVDALRYLVLWEYEGIYLTHSPSLSRHPNIETTVWSWTRISTTGAHLAHCAAPISLRQQPIRLSFPTDLW